VKEKKRRPTPPLTASWLQAEAVQYLQRWPASESRVRRLLWRRVKRAQSFHGGTHEEAAPLIDEVMDWLGRHKFVDDARYARLWIDSLRRRGTSRRMIFKKLQEKGVPKEHIAKAIEDHEPEEGGDPEETSALAYAKRRRLGPYRVPLDESWERKRKDLASMARAGFSYGVAQAVLVLSSE
jgi:regulatory protein